MEIWKAVSGAEDRVRAAERVFDHQVDVETVRAFLADTRSHLLIAYVDGDPAGFVSGAELTHPDKARPELFVNELGVLGAYQSRGIGRALVSALWEIAQRRGCRGMWVLTDEGNVAALKVYGATGGMRMGDQVLFQWGET